MEPTVLDKDSELIAVIPCLFSVVHNVISRNGVGYKVKTGDDWYEVSVTACEPPDTDSVITDALP